MKHAKCPYCTINETFSEEERRNFNPDEVYSEQGFPLLCYNYNEIAGCDISHVEAKVTISRDALSGIHCIRIDDEIDVDEIPIICCPVCGRHFDE